MGIHMNSTYAASSGFTVLYGTVDIYGVGSMGRLIIWQDYDNLVGYQQIYEYADIIAAL